MHSPNIKVAPHILIDNAIPALISSRRCSVKVALMETEQDAAALPCTNWLGEKCFSTVRSGHIQSVGLDQWKWTVPHIPKKVKMPLRVGKRSLQLSAQDVAQTLPFSHPTSSPSVKGHCAICQQDTGGGMGKHWAPMERQEGQTTAMSPQHYSTVVYKVPVLPM